MTSPAGNTEPTAEQHSVATQLVLLNSTHGGDARIDFADAIARALAAAVTAEREKYLRVADELEADADEDTSDATTSFEAGCEQGYIFAARRIREVTT